jgi:hypothetical protein
MGEPVTGLIRPGRDEAVRPLQGTRSVLWLVARPWLGYEWLNAGYQKLWGSEKAGFWNGGGGAGAK